MSDETVRACGTIDRMTDEILALRSQVATLTAELAEKTAALEQARLFRSKVEEQAMYGMGCDLCGSRSRGGPVEHLDCCALKSPGEEG